MKGYSALSGILGAPPIFEDAARLLGFSKAARELGMTQPASPPQEILLRHGRVTYTP